MRWIIIAPAEAALTGLVLIVGPSLFAWLILGAQLTAPGEALGRIADNVQNLSHIRDWRLLLE